MHDFKCTNKVSGVHWLKDPIDNLKISVKIKPQEGVLSLPKFENYANISNGANTESFDQTEEFAFKWQEKVFSMWEIQRYSDVHHCITDTELTYHNMLNDLHHEPLKVFTYVHDDYYLPLPINCVKEKSKIIELSSCLERLNLNEKIEKTFMKESSSMGNLFSSEENLDVGNEHWTAMHVVFDSSDYNEDSQLVFKQEAILVSLYHNTAHNYLLVSPNENQLELNPYCLETGADVPLGRHYSIELRFEEEEEDAEELTVLLNKLHKKWEKKHRQLVNFCMPPIGRKVCHLSLEILTAAEFEGDDLYVEYTIKVPEEIQCKDPLHGRTHTTKVLRSDEVEEWGFGHIVDLVLEIDATTEPLPLQVFFEVISADWWGRHRTEGYSYLALPLQPGSSNNRLSCSRPEELDSVEASSRRFFVGGCNLIKDLDVLAKPQLQDANFVYTTTGSITIRWNAITQSPLPGHSRPSYSQSESGRSASALLLGAEAVLRQYRRARARLAAATRDFRDQHDGSGDGPSIIEG